MEILFLRYQTLRDQFAYAETRRRASLAHPDEGVRA
jgi:hypothetical protein